MKKVLIVDDAVIMRTVLRTMLEGHGYEVVGEGENGVIGVQKYIDLKPDLVTLDITMPEMSGLDALKAIKQYDPGANVVMVSAMGQTSFVKEAIMSGAKNFIVKPFKEEHVMETLKKLLPT